MIGFMVFRKDNKMIDKSKISDIYNESLNNSKQEFESMLINKLEKYIRNNKSFTIDELCKYFNDDKYSDNYTRETIKKALGNFYVGIKETKGDVEIYKYQNKFVHTIFRNFDFNNKPNELIGYEKCYNYADDDVFSQDILKLYDRVLKYKSKMEGKINNELIKSAKQLSKTCIIDLFQMIPSTVSKKDIYLIAVYNYIFRRILNESEILFEVVKNKEICSYYSYDFEYKYKIIGFMECRTQ